MYQTVPTTVRIVYSPCLRACYVVIWHLFCKTFAKGLCDYSVTKWDSSEIDTVWYMSYQALQQLMFLVTSLQIAIHFWHYICNKCSILLLLIFMFPVCKFWRHYRSEILLSVRIWKVMNMVLRQCLFLAGTEIFFWYFDWSIVPSNLRYATVVYYFWLSHCYRVLQFYMLLSLCVRCLDLCAM